MGGSAAKPDPVPEEAGTSSLDKVQESLKFESSQRQSDDLGLPYFFLASCPETDLVRAVEVARQYGGFNCVGPGPEYAAAFASLLTGTGRQSFAAWKGKAEGQYMMLKDLSPAGRQVTCVAIAGLGGCEDERSFLERLSQRAGHEQLKVKVCRDVDDMERWLKGAGYTPTEVLGLAVKSANHTMKEAHMATMKGGHLATTSSVGGADKLWNSVTSFFGGDPSDSAQARRERLLGDVHMAIQDAVGVDNKGIEAIRKAKDKLVLVIKEALEAGVAQEELVEAETRQEELQRLLIAASGWCFMSRGAPAQDEVEIQANTAPATCTFCCYSAPKPKEQEAEWQTSSASTPALKASANSQSNLTAGTRCSYFSSSRAGWIDAVVQGFNEEDYTYDLDVRPHARPEHICPPLSGKVSSKAEAWAPGTLVEYRRTTNDQRLNARIIAFNQGRSGPDTYDLDVKENAAIQQIRAPRHQ